MSEKKEGFNGLHLVSNRKPTNVSPIVNKKSDETSLEVIQVLSGNADPSLQDEIDDFIRNSKNIGFGNLEEQVQLNNLREGIRNFDEENDKGDD